MGAAGRTTPVGTTTDGPARVATNATAKDRVTAREPVTATGGPVTAGVDVVTAGADGRTAARTGGPGAAGAGGPGAAAPGRPAAAGDPAVGLRPVITTARNGRVRVKSGHGPDGSWEIAVAPPHPRLRPGIMGYRGIRLALNGPCHKLQAPVGAAVLAFGFGEPIHISRSGRPLATLTSPYCAPTTTAIVGAHAGRLSGIEVTLMPWAAFSLFGVPHHELAGPALNPDDLPHALGGDRTGSRWRSVDDVSGALAALPTWAERFRLLDDVFTQWLAAGTPSSPRVVHAWAELVRHWDTMPVARLADQVGWSVRQLEKRFREQIGLGPKAATRVLRLEHARSLLAAGHSQAETAALCGFYDQSHLSNEFRAMLGCTPRQFASAPRLPTVTPPDRFPGEASRPAFFGVGRTTSPDTT